MLSICAVIALRNEAPYLRVLLPLLAGQQIEVAILDNGSTDGSHEICSEHLGNPVTMIGRIPYRGYFSLSDQLAAKQKLYNRIRHDWIIHQDADEVLENFSSGLTLRDGIQEADESGCNALDFDEFVFLPEADTDYANANYFTDMLRYYFFQPEKNRLNRAWKRTMHFDDTSTGGHRLFGEGLAVFPIRHILRHYIVLGYEHAKQKYLDRTFDVQDLKRRWHGNRLNFTERNLKIPRTSKFLFQLDSYDSRAFCKDEPAPDHYWDWK